jgi:tetratricopeptide (TPR) repeat protein
VSGEKIFVGRKAELEQFKKVLEDPQGQAVLVVGHRGMGKTWLINKISEIAENHPSLKCGCMRYEVTPTDSVDSTMALIMDNAFEAAQIEDGSFSGTAHRLEQWRSLLNVINLGDLIMSLRRDPAKNTRDQFLERLQLISKRMPENGRAIFIIDPEKYMQKDSDQSWAIVVKGLPDKIKLIFAQRTEDVLVESTTFAALDNISHIPERRLDVLEEQAVDELLDKRVAELDYNVTEVRKILSKYKGHPYALQGALDLLKAGSKLEELPQDPTGIAAAQWKELCKRGKEAIRLFKAYAILEVGVPDEVVTAVSELDTDTLQSILADNFLGGLLREEGYGKRIYHVILSDYILDEMDESDKKGYQTRVVKVYRQKLAEARKKQAKIDELAAIRLAEHVLAAEGKMAFVQTFVKYGNELQNLGLFDAFVNLSERALVYVEEGSAWQAAVLGNLGLIYRKRGDLNKAEKMHKKSLEIAEKLEQLDGMAHQYGNLGLIYINKGDLNKAEEMFRKGMEIEEKLGRPEGMANVYSNLGLIYFSRGDMQTAEKMHQKALEIDERIGRLKGIAVDYGNLGGIYWAQGDLEKAEQTLRDSLKINEKLGQLEGMANDYGNIGTVYKHRGDIEKAREYWKKALKLYKKVSMKPEVEKVQGWIDELDKGSDS